MKPNAVEVEKKLLSAMMLQNGQIIPKVAALVAAADFCRPDHQVIYRVLTQIYFGGTPPDILAVEHELNRTGELAKIDRAYLFSLVDMEFTTARAEYHARIIKEKSNLRKLIHASQAALDNAQQGFHSPPEIISETQKIFDEINQAATRTKRTTFADFFANDFDAEINELKDYVNRRSGFENLDAEQFFSPGIYVIGATPAAGKTTFCWQLLEQFARRGETCIYCSYEMSRLELFTKSLARELFKRVPNTCLTAADIRKGAWSVQLDYARAEFAADSINLSVFELQDETIDELLAMLRPLCTDKKRAPIVCLDYLQIMPTSRDSTKLGIDDAVRKLKKFQRDTNTTFFVISSFNRTNYAHAVSFESFKESGNIEYTADVVLALQLNLLNELKSHNDITETRKRIDAAKRQQPRQINLRCLKNRQGTNYDCYFRYYSAHDCFAPCDKEDFKSISPNENKGDDSMT